ncbi:hypothetical protein [uncultured Sneathiella sp.]|uniref:hypothetical protein n=1 Tax=uncultured Sneathiella sp. TaxID=879315 RepID=UPI0030EDEA6F|tara:strand:+ start:436 stop:1350 length:915 start_codon:yes stop_codon:yes gene_type:complete
MRELMASSDHFPVSFEVRLEVFRHQVAGLSRIRRWNGACDVSVAQHCVQACDLASPETAGYALIHDIEEFDTGDITTPVKNTMRSLGIWQRFASEIVLPIRRRFTLLAGLEWPWPEGVIREIHEIDQKLKATEYRDCVDLSLVRLSAKDLAEPYQDYMLPWSATKAENVFMERAQNVLPSMAKCDAGDVRERSHCSGRLIEGVTDKHHELIADAQAAITSLMNEACQTKLRLAELEQAFKTRQEQHLPTSDDMKKMSPEQREAALQLRAQHSADLALQSGMRKRLAFIECEIAHWQERIALATA